MHSTRRKLYARLEHKYASAGRTYEEILSWHKSNYGQKDYDDTFATRLVENALLKDAENANV